MTMSFQGEVKGHLACVLLDSGASESFMSIAYADQLRLTWSAEEAVTRLGHSKIGIGGCHGIGEDPKKVAAVQEWGQVPRELGGCAHSWALLTTFGDSSRAFCL